MTAGCKSPCFKHASSLHHDGVGILATVTSPYSIAIIRGTREDLMMTSSGPGPRPGNVEGAVPRARSASLAVRNPERTMFDNQVYGVNPM